MMKPVSSSVGLPLANATLANFYMKLEHAYVHCPSILGKILRYCPSESYETLRNVSKRWDQVTDRYVGRVLIVKSGNSFMVDPESNMDRMSIRANYWMTLSSERCLTETSTCAKTEKDATDESVENETGDVVEEVEKLQDISNPEKVRKIGFVGHLGLAGYQPLECILSPCTNITSLYLHLSLFCLPKGENIDGKQREPWLVSCCLPYLKEMVIDSCGMSSEDSTDHFSYKSTFLALACFLCSQKFVGLEKAIFAMPYMESVEGILVRALCIFLGRHAESIKSFSFTQKYELSDEPDEDDANGSGDEENDKQGASDHQHKGDGDRFGGGIKFPTNVNYLSLSQLALSAKELKSVCLDELHVVLVGRQESAPVWKNLLIKQSNMKKCIYAGDKIPLPGGAIEVNSPTLVTVRLDIRDGVNLEFFRACVHLKHLSLGGRNDADESCDADVEGDETSSLNGIYQQPIQLKNANRLPVGLESLEIINLRTHKNDARVLALELPSLRDLTMKNLGWEGNLGLRLSDLVKVYEMGKLDHLCIKASLNLMSYSELEEESPSPALNLFACVVQSNSFAAASRFFLEVWKREGGLYSTRKSEIHVEVEEEELDVFQVPNKVELREEEEEESCSSSDSEEEDEDDDDRAEETGEGEENDETEKEVVTDEEWQECEDEASEDDEEGEEN